MAFDTIPVTALPSNRNIMPTTQATVGRLSGFEAFASLGLEKKEKMVTRMIPGKARYAESIASASNIDSSFRSPQLENSSGSQES